MNRPYLAVSLAVLVSASIGSVRAQQTATPEARNQSSAPGNSDNQSSPLYRVTVEARSTKAINYSHAKGSTPIDFKGTVLMPYAKGSAQVEGKKGVVSISAKFEKLLPATQYGPQFLTYVL